MQEEDDRPDKPRRDGRVGSVERVKHRRQREAEDADERHEHQDDQSVIGADELFAEQQANERLARRGAGSGSQAAATALASAVPRSISFHGFLAGEVHSHDFRIEGLGEQVGRLGCTVRKGRRDAEQRRARWAEQAADDQAARSVPMQPGRWRSG